VAVDWLVACARTWTRTDESCHSLFARRQKTLTEVGVGTGAGVETAGRVGTGTGTNAETDAETTSGALNPSL